jgi:iron complex outermembrane receptor protein
VRAPGEDPRLAALLSAAVFYKNITNFIQNTTSAVTLNVTQVQGGGTIAMPFTLSQPRNAGGANLKGVEVGYQQPFSFLPGLFNRFGALANYTYIKANDVVLTQGGPAVPLTVVSRSSYNVGAYYESPVLGAHLVYNYRSEYVSDPLSDFGDGAFVKAYGQLDLSAALHVTRYASFVFQVVNVGDRALVTTDAFGINRGYELDGRRFTLGIRVAL